MSNAPRLLIGGTGSGCGKTTVSLAFMAALQARGLGVRACKCGPDYIDPMFHKATLGVASCNLDLFLADAVAVRDVLAWQCAEGDITVIEGVMGYYDGIGGVSTAASASDVAVKTDTPSVLVVSPQGMSVSLAAMVQGFLDFGENTIQGVILNGISAGMYPLYQQILQEQGITTYGFLPKEQELTIGSRHLGLLTASEVDALAAKVARLGQLAAQHIDLDGLLALARTAPALPRHVSRAVTTPCVRIGVAQDKAFCFYYEENLRMLEAQGAALVPFSPLADAALPEHLDALYLGGGYPELYAAELAQNAGMRQDIFDCGTRGMPIFAECGGFLYLQETLEGAPMVGLIPGHARMTQKLQHFGYITLTAQKDTLLCKRGAQLRAHEFHYAETDAPNDAFLAEKPKRSKTWRGIYAEGNIFAGWPHFYFAGNDGLAARLVRAAQDYQKERQHG